MPINNSDNELVERLKTEITKLKRLRGRKANKNSRHFVLHENGMPLRVADIDSPTSQSIRLRPEDIHKATLFETPEHAKHFAKHANCEIGKPSEVIDITIKSKLALLDIMKSC